MYVCICKQVTDRQIRRAVAEGSVRNMRTLRRELGGCDQCGKCAAEAKRIINDTMGEDISFRHCATAPS
ncbi:MAG: bacterioferritin [Gammaproteobacteria bacterium]|nr:bacterioferritin [Gammaproteobacteria bacterium]